MSVQWPARTVRNLNHWFGNVLANVGSEFQLVVRFGDAFVCPWRHPSPTTSSMVVDAVTDVPCRPGMRFKWVECDVDRLNVFQQMQIFSHFGKNKGPLVFLLNQFQYFSQ